MSAEKLVEHFSAFKDCLAMINRRKINLERLNRTARNQINKTGRRGRRGRRIMIWIYP